MNVKYGKTLHEMSVEYATCKTKDEINQFIIDVTPLAKSLIENYVDESHIEDVYQDVVLALCENIASGNVSQKTKCFYSCIERIVVRESKKYSMQNNVSLSEIFNMEDEVTLEDRVMSSILRPQIDSVFFSQKRFNGNQKRAIALRFGFEDGCCYTYSAAAEKMGYSSEYIRRIEARTLRILRHKAYCGYLRELCK